MAKTTEKATPLVDCPGVTASERALLRALELAVDDEERDAIRAIIDEKHGGVAAIAQRAAEA